MKIQNLPKEACYAHALDGATVSNQFQTTRFLWFKMQQCVNAIVILFLLLLLGLRSQAQCSFTMVTNGISSTNFQGLNPNFSSGRANWIVTQAELTAMGLANGSVITGIGGLFAVAPEVTTSGNLRVYMENTGDNNNNKAANWSTLLTGMSDMRNGSYTIPANSTGWAAYFNTNFTYTGQSIYIAIEWINCSGPVSTNAEVLCNNIENNSIRRGGNTGGSCIPPPTIGGTSELRPGTVFYLDQNSAFTYLLSITNNVDIRTISGSSNFYFVNNCRLIAATEAAGGNPVSGTTVGNVWIESYQPLFFVRRHYQIAPTTNLFTATGKVCLYFTQQEFDDFNALPTNVLKLPTGPTDAAGIANLRVEQRYGLTNDATGLPESYTSGNITINPNDGDIVWNTLASRWEVCFITNGFGGYFVKTNPSVLPVKWISLNGSLDARQHGQISWQVQEQNVVAYEVQQSSNAIDFERIGHLSAKGNGIQQYQFSTNTTVSAKSYFRIKEVSLDGMVTHSKIILLHPSSNGESISVYPNPTVNNFSLNLMNSRLMHTKACLFNQNGQLLKTININGNNTFISLEDNCKGIYYLKLENGTSIKVVKQ
jgi:hypothetical protein